MRTLNRFPHELARGGMVAANDGLLHIGLINNLPDSALEQTERQFFRLFNANGQKIPVRWHLFSLLSIPRGQSGHLHLIHQNYRDARELFQFRLDGLIVTGTEPTRQNLAEELYWAEFSEVLDWIALEGPPAIFSCLAAHAAVLRYSGLPRSRLSQKCSGVFEHTVTEGHAFTANLSSPLQVAHSRWNELPADMLEEAGYEVLTAAPDAGVDLFSTRARNLLLFFQGHPEYDQDTLAREYRRDVRRYLDAESDWYPELPSNYFRNEEARALLRFRMRALQERDGALMAGFPAVVGRRKAHSRTNAVAERWLRYLWASRSERTGPPPARLCRAGLFA